MRRWRLRRSLGHDHYYTVNQMGLRLLRPIFIAGPAKNAPPPFLRQPHSDDTDHLSFIRDSLH